MKLLFWIISGYLMVISGVLDFKIFGEFGYMGAFTPISIMSAMLITIFWAKYYPKEESESKFSKILEIVRKLKN